MIQVQELRLNNLVYWGVNIVPIKSIHIESVLKDKEYVYVSVNEKLNHHCVDLTDIEPIPISPEILEKCGFEKYMGVYNLSKEEELGHHFGDFSVSVYDETQMKIWKGKRYLGIIHCRYLHELQNLYYALTKQELIFKP